MLDKVKNVLTIKKICYLFFFAICFLLFIFDLKSEKLSVNLLFGLFAVTILLIISFLNYKFKKIDDKSYYKFYAFAVFVIGFILIVITPPFMGSDERTHFFRAYEITEGHFISQVDENGIISVMPRSLNKAYSGYDNENIYDEDATISYNEIPSRLAIPLNKSDLLNYCSCNKTNYFGASMYSPFQYLPQLIGIEIGKFLDLGPILITYLARAFNLISFAILTIIGLKLLPKFKLFAMLVLLSPVVLSGATTISADGITNAILFLFISYIVNIIYNKKTVAFKDKIALYLISFMIAMCKIVYFPFLAFIFLIPKSQFKSNKDNWIFKISLFVFGIILSLGWLYIASAFLNSQSSTSELQVKYVLSHPLNFIFIVLRTYINNFSENLNNIFFGDQMYHWSLKVYSLFSLAFVFVVYLSLFSKKDDLRLSKKAKGLIICLLVIVLGLIASALFVQNNVEVGTIIGGIQARYFIPLIFLIPLFIKVKNIKFSDKVIFSLFIGLYFPVFLTIAVRFI